MEQAEKIFITKLNGTLERTGLTIGQLRAMEDYELQRLGNFGRKRIKRFRATYGRSEAGMQTVTLNEQEWQQIMTLLGTKCLWVEVNMLLLKMGQQLQAQTQSPLNTQMQAQPGNSQDGDQVFRSNTSAPRG